MISHIGLNYGTGSIKHALIHEWDDGYKGKIDPDHWIIAQGLHDQVSQVLPDHLYVPHAPYSQLINVLGCYYTLLLPNYNHQKWVISMVFRYIERYLCMLRLHKEEKLSLVNKTSYDLGPEFRLIDSLFAAMLALQKELGLGFGHFWVQTRREHTTDQDFRYRGCLTESLFNAGIASFNRALRVSHSRDSTKTGIWEQQAKKTSMTNLNAVIRSGSCWNTWGSVEHYDYPSQLRSEARLFFAIPLCANADGSHNQDQSDTSQAL